MVRALYLAQKEQSITVGLLYQAPEAAADASEASGAVQLQLAQADTLAKALAAAQKQLPQKADYRLCDYLLIDQDASAELLAAYERTVLENRQGRVSAKVSVLEMDDGFLEELPAEKQEFPNKLLEQLKQCADQMPRLYQYQDGMLLPQLRAEKQEVALADTSILWRVENSIELEARQAETARLLREMGGVHTFWLEGEPVTVRRCSVSVTLREETASLRLDCQRSYDTPQPSAAQCEQLAELCTQTVQSFWQQGIDLVHLQQRSALQNGVGREKITIKNACPQLQADVRFYRCDSVGSGEGDSNGSAHIHLAFQLDACVVDACDMLDDGKAQTGTAGSLAAALVHTIEALKHAGLCFFRDADAVIGHSQGAVSVAAAGCGDLYLTAGTIITDRIIAQVLA